MYAPGKELGRKQTACRLYACACDFVCSTLGVAISASRELLPNDVVEHVDLRAAWLAARSDSEFGIFLNKLLPDHHLALTVNAVYGRSVASKRFESFGKPSVINQPLLHCAPNAHHRCARLRQSADERERNDLMREAASPDTYCTYLRHALVKTLLALLEPIGNRDFPSSELVHAGFRRKIGDISEGQAIFKDLDIPYGTALSARRAQRRIPVGVEAYFQQQV